MKKLLLFCTAILLTVSVHAQQFDVSFSKDVLSEPFTGNVLLYLSQENKNPKNAFVPLELPPVYRVQVTNLQPNEGVMFDDSAISYPNTLSNIERDTYYVQVVFDRNLGGQAIGTSPGNLYSKPQQVIFDKNFDTTHTLQADQVVPEIPFTETKHLKELALQSEVLSEFHDKEVTIAGAVSLPDEYYENLDATYPVLFSVFGFGANYKTHSGSKKYAFTHLADTPAIVVYLDGNSPEGHSTYANSDINGPWGDALVNEFIPALETQYRTNGAKFVFGHSSGGWTSLWLQLNYPETFSGAWASAPDQVDFRNWQGENIYEVDNLYYDPNGNLLADITMGGGYPIIAAKDMYQVEHVVYRGDQIHSFDAVFSSRDADGEIIRLVDAETGNINKEALPLFKRYDLSYQIRTNWETYKDAVNNDIRISIGEHDNFHLHKAVHLFDDEMKKLESTIEIDYYPGDHFTVFTKEYKEDGQQFLDTQYQEWQQENK